MYRLKYLLYTIIVVTLSLPTQAQYESNVNVGEYGLMLGTAHYYGDLNPDPVFDHPKLAIGAFYQRQFNNYIGLRLSAQYARLGYSDKFSANPIQRIRNLSFNSDIWEFALQGQFNFFKFQPYNPNYRWTPYLTAGVGITFFNPFAFLQGKKYFLQPLGTEGQNAIPGHSLYDLFAVCIPVGAGFKYNISDNINIGLEAAYRFTTTDYLDDVSTTYAGAAAFKNPSPAFSLQDRSTEFGPAIGAAGFQRGNSTRKDGYLFIQCTLSFSIMSYKCPPVK